MTIAHVLNNQRIQYQSVIHSWASKYSTNEAHEVFGMKQTVYAD